MVLHRPVELARLIGNWLLAVLDRWLPLYSQATVPCVVEYAVITVNPDGHTIFTEGENTEGENNDAEPAASRSRMFCSCLADALFF